MKISMEKVLLINGSPHAKGCTYTALREVADSLEKNGVATEIVHLGPRGVPGCIWGAMYARKQAAAPWMIW